MAVTEHQRHEFRKRVGSSLGEDTADVLMEYLPPVGWADVATKHDLAALEQRIDLRFDLLRTDMSSLRSELQSDMEKGFRRQMMWMVGTMIALQATTVAALAVTR